MAMSLRNLPALVVPALLVLASLPASAAEHDFDFAVGTFRSHVRRLQKPLTGSTTWFEATGEVRTRKVLNGLGELEQIELDQPTGHLEALNLRLWNPVTRLWSIHFANARGGTMPGPASVGGFKGGRGEFYDQEEWDGRMILVRHTFSEAEADSYRFEQAFSADGGKTWEANWIADCRRVEELPAVPEAKDRNRDFDFNLGKWHARVSRFTGGKWADFDGTAEVTPLWGGRANMAELRAGPLEGLSVRLYNPQAQTWSLYWVSATGMTLEVAPVGSFARGRGDFVDVEAIDGRQTFVRESFFPPSKFEAAYSFDGGRTWEPRMRITFERFARDG
jgi:hypothetical protein